MIVSLKNEYSVHSGNDIDLYKSFRIIYNNYYKLKIIFYEIKICFCLSKVLQIYVVYTFFKQLLFSTTLCF